MADERRADRPLQTSLSVKKPFKKANVKKTPHPIAFYTDTPPRL